MTLLAATGAVCDENHAPAVIVVRAVGFVSFFTDAEWASRYSCAVSSKQLDWEFKWSSKTKSAPVRIAVKRKSGHRMAGAIDARR